MNAVYDYGERRKEEGIKQGIKEGIKEGKEEENKKIAIKMLKNNEDMEKIKEYIDISEDEIIKLKKEIENKN